MELQHARDESVSAPSIAWMSAVLPGLGQVVQGRRMVGATQFLTVMTYLIAAGNLGGWKPMLLAILWNAWSCFDAWRYEST